MIARVAFDDHPGAAAGAVIPMFVMPARRVVPEVDIFEHRTSDVALGISGALQGGVAEVAELACVPRPAIWAFDAHGFPMKWCLNEDLVGRLGPFRREYVPTGIGRDAIPWRRGGAYR